MVANRRFMSAHESGLNDLQNKLFVESQEKIQPYRTNVKEKMTVRIPDKNNSFRLYLD